MEDEQKILEKYTVKQMLYLDDMVLDFSGDEIHKYCHFSVYEDQVMHSY